MRFFLYKSYHFMNMVIRRTQSSMPTNRKKCDNWSAVS